MEALASEIQKKKKEKEPTYKRNLKLMKERLSLVFDKSKRKKSK